MLGSGTIEDPYQVWTKEDLDNVRNNLNAFYLQMANINIDEYNWIPIGTEQVSFLGNYNGNDFIISNLTINQPTLDYVGLFGCFDGRYNNTKLENINLENVDILGGWYIGALVGEIYLGTIINCRGNGLINGEGLIGGLVGHLFNSNIENSHTICNIIARRNFADGTGGIVGLTSVGSIINCSSSGTIYSDSYSSMGGIAGDIYLCDIINSHSSCNILGDGGNNTNLGGLVGYAAGGCTIKKSYATGDITATGSPSIYIGGLIGRAGSNIVIENCYAVGDLYNQDYYNGGIIGYTYSSQITNCYYAGSLICVGDTYGYAGGITGAENYSGTIVTNCYYDTEVSGMNDVDMGEPKTTIEMKTRSTYENWDFVDIWQIDPSKNNGYPIFIQEKKVPILINCKSVVPSFIQLSRGSISSS